MTYILTDKAVLDAAVAGSFASAAMLARAIRECFAQGDAETVRSFAEAQHPADLVNILGGLNADEQIRVLQLVAPAVRAEAFGYFPRADQLEIAGKLTRRELTDLIAAMSHDERADLFNALPEDEQQRLLPGLAQAERDDIRKLSSYEEGTAGAIMTSDYAVLTSDLTTQQALARLRQEAPDRETIYVAYVVDAQRRLVGTVSLQKLILADPHEPVGDLMRPDPVFANAHDDQEYVAQLIQRYDLLALPIINGGDMLVGIVTHDDAMDVTQEEATEDIHKGASVGKLAVSVGEAALSTLYRKRVVWLLLLVFGNLFSGAGIAYFEDTIAAYVALVFFLPLLIDSGGNAGSQSATLMVRALATGEVVMRDWARMLGREVGVALALGVTMAVAVSSIGIFRGGPEIALVVALTMVLVVMVGSLIGMSLPFILSRLKMDPATASAPLVTSICDAVGVVIYFGIATALLTLPAAG